jgi:hypothetical protein
VDSGRPDAAAAWRIYSRIADESSSASSLLNLGRPDGEQGRLLTRAAEDQVNPYAAHSRPSVPPQAWPSTNRSPEDDFYGSDSEYQIVSSSEHERSLDGSIMMPIRG